MPASKCLINPMRSVHAHPHVVILKNRMSGNDWSAVETIILQALDHQPGKSYDCGNFFSARSRVLLTVK